QEECLIQEKEIARLNLVQEEQETKMKLLQKDFLQIQQQKDVLSLEYERCKVDLHNMKHHREDENRTYSQEFDKINNELTALRIAEVTLLKTIDELKENLSIVTNERDQIRAQYNNYQANLENIQQILYDESESSSKSAAKVIQLTRQLEDEQKRANDSKYQLNELQMQLTTALLTIDTVKAELSQSRCVIQENLDKENEFKQNLARMKTSLNERSRSLDERQREIETLNQLMSHLQTDYEKSKSDLSVSQDKLVHMEVENETLRRHLLDKTNEITSLTEHFQQSQYDFHVYEKDHRYSNEEYLLHEQKKKSIENELITITHNYDKLQKEHQKLNENFNKCQHDLQQNEKSDIVHKEQLMQSMDCAKIYKQKLALLGECFKMIIRKASETSEQWADLTTHLDELITDLSNETERFHLLGECFEKSIKLSNQLQLQHEDSLGQFFALKSNVAKIHLHLREYKQKSSQMHNENLHLHVEVKRLHEKIENYHRIENLMRIKSNEQEIGLQQLRKELNHELQARSEAQRLAEQLTMERNQLLKNNSSVQKKIDKLQKDVSSYADEKRVLQQTIDKLEEQCSLQSQSLEQSQRSYQDQIHECESLLISLSGSNKNSLLLLEEKTQELDTARSEMQSLKHEHSSKIEQFEETSQEFQRHIVALEQSIKEQKLVIRKLENELEETAINSSANNTVCAKHDTEIDFLRMENASLTEQLRLIQENLHPSHSGSFLSNGISDVCFNHVNGSDPSNEGNEKTLLPLVHDLTFGLNDHLNSHKKYKLMKAYSKQQQFLLNQLEAQVHFYESIFQQRCLPAIECSSICEVLNDNEHF
ncbi:unnamed protein product, partial [Adineta ricciae]